MEILGLPLHPLIVHAVVVLVPLAALGGIAISLLRWARIRYGWLVVAGALAGAVSTIVAEQAGQSFAETFTQLTPAAQYHTSIGGGLTLWAILLFVGSLLVMGAQFLIDRNDHRGNIALLIGIAVTVVSAIVATVQTVRIGHAGATAVWGG